MRKKKPENRSKDSGEFRSYPCDIKIWKRVALLWGKSVFLLNRKMNDRQKGAEMVPIIHKQYSETVQ